MLVTTPLGCDEVVAYGHTTVVSVSTTVVTPPRVWVPEGTVVVDAAQTVVVSVSVTVVAGKVYVPGVGHVYAIGVGTVAGPALVVGAGAADEVEDGGGV
jgi:hypothetical protein